MNSQAASSPPELSEAKRKRMCEDTLAVSGRFERCDGSQNAKQHRLPVSRIHLGPMSKPCALPVSIPHMKKHSEAGPGILGGASSTQPLWGHNQYRMQASSCTFHRALGFVPSTPKPWPRGPGGRGWVPLPGARPSRRRAWRAPRGLEASSEQEEQ